MPSNPVPSPVRASRHVARATAQLIAGLFVATGASAHELRAQSVTVAPRDAWTVDAQYLHPYAGSMHPRFTPSFEATFGRDVGDARAAEPAWRIEAGWLRSVRPTTTAQGATLGLSAGFAAPGTRDGDGWPRLTVRPGVSLLAGWADRQDSSSFYDGRGVGGTPAGGASGSEYSFTTARGATMGVGVTLGAELRLTHAIGLSGSVRRWMFSGSVMAPSRQVTLLGLGVAMHPSALLHDARHAWRSLSVRDDHTPRHHAARTARATAHGVDVSIDADSRP